jgi:hypothetical protein
MLVPLLQVLFAAIRTVSRSALNIMLYSMLSRIFNKWFGFNTVISFFCSAYCLSKIVGYFQRLWQNARLTNKKPDEKIVINELTWESPTTIAMRCVKHTNNFLMQKNNLVNSLYGFSLLPSLIFRTRIKLKSI